MVHSFSGRAAHLCLLETMRDARPGLTVEPPLVIYDAEGVYSSEMRRIYGME